MKTIIKYSDRNKRWFYSSSFKSIRIFGFLMGVFTSMVVNGQSINKLMIGSFKTNQSITIESADYVLRCPITWRVDSVENLLTITPRLMWRDSIIISIHSFKTDVLPFKTFMKDPTVDFDAKTVITANSNSTVYKVISTKHCDTCENQNKKREQYYNVLNNKVYIVYYTASNKLLKRYKDDLDLILTSFKLKD